MLKQMILEEKLDFLQQTFERWVNRPMPTNLRAQMKILTQEKHCPKNTQMITLGELPTEIYFICKGLCRSYYIDNKGNDITRFFVLEGDFCLTEVQILAVPSELCVETLEDCDFLAFRIVDLQRLTQSDFLKDVYIQALQSNIRYKIKRESSFLLNSATERYLDFRRCYPGLEQRITQGQLASYLGITPTSLSRIRRALRLEYDK